MRLGNVIIGSALILLGGISFLVSDDGTFFLFSLMFGVPVIFSKMDVIADCSEEK